MAITPLSSEDDLADRLGQYGVNLRLDDQPPKDVQTALTRATTTLYRYARRRYSVAQLAQSNVAADIDADLAAFYLCVRRGNPPPAPIGEAYQRAIEDLKLLEQGVWHLPDASPLALSAPVLSNVTVRMHPTPHPRVQRGRSTGERPSEYRQRVDHSDPLHWWDWQI